MREQLQEMLALVYELNETRDEDWFFNYSGHVNSVGIHHSTPQSCGECGEVKHVGTYLCHVADPSEWPALIEQLKTYLKEQDGD